jgi:hypothetical protein
MAKELRPCLLLNSVVCVSKKAMITPAGILAHRDVKKEYQLSPFSQNVKSAKMIIDR